MRSNRLGPWVLGVAVVVAALLAGCVPSPDTDPQVAVATTSMVVVDNTRSTPARGTEPAHPYRRLPTSVWYPAEGTGPWPLIVFAHGYDVSPQYYDRLLSRWAAAGYVVAAPLFPISGSPGPGLARQDIEDQPKDLSAVVTAVLGPNVPAAIAGRVDGSRIAAAGHSDGGSTVAALALNAPLRDPRIDSYLVLAGALPPVPGPYDGQNTGPLLVVQGDQDPYNLVSDARPVYAYTVNPPKAFVVVPGAGHTEPFLSEGPPPDTVRAATVDWLNLTLKDDATARDRFLAHASSPGLTRLEASTGLS